MAQITATFTVPSSPQAAFDLVADFRSTASWDPGIRSARRLDAGPIGLGSRFEVTLALGPFGAPLVYEITAFVPHEHLTLETTGSWHRGRDDVRFRAVDGGTEVHWDAAFSLLGPGGLLDPALEIGFRRAAGDAVAGLAEALGGRLDEDAIAR